MKELLALKEIVERQGAEIARLKARKAKTSRTSSKPPSTDEPWVKRKSQRSRSGKQRGGQSGHAGQGRKLAAPEDIDEVKCVKPQQCGSCGEDLEGDAPAPRLHQVVDIPPIDPFLVEYQLHDLDCLKCGAKTKAVLPEDVPSSQFGPNLSALVVMLSGVYRMSRRNVQRFIADTYGIEIALGSISNIERRTSEALSDSHAAAVASVAASPVKHLDETSWRESNEGAWLWAGVGKKATAFLIRPTRGSGVAREMIGDEPSGVVVSDRFSGYSFIDLEQRQVCLAHLVRDFRRMAEGEMDLRWIGERALGLTGALFRLWHMHLAKEIDRKTLKRWVWKIRSRLVQVLDEGATSVGWDTPKLCRGILKTEGAIWTFIEVEGVPPTNNAAEQAIRPAVISRKTSFGTQSERGSRFIERMLTCSATLRASGRSVHQFILDTTHSVATGAPSPVLLR